jgi:thiamine-monophosphate kinase
VADLPISPAGREAARAAGQVASDWALTGGEDYELMFTVAADSADRIRGELEAGIGTPCRVIGRIVAAEQGVLLRFPDGSARPPGAVSGWDHFRTQDK